MGVPVRQDINRMAITSLAAVRKRRAEIDAQENALLGVGPIAG